MAVAMPLSASQANQPVNPWAASVNAFKAANWTNGTANGLTPAQNQAAVINQPGNTVNKATPQMQGILGQAAKDTAAAQQPPSGGFVPVGTLGSGTPNTGGQMPPSSGGSAPPKFDAAGISASRVAAQRAALAASNAAYDTSRTAAYKYAQGTTQGNRALLQFDNSNRGDQFGGSAREDLFRLQRSQGIEDTAANQAYQNDLAASDAKLAAFDAGSAGMQQDIQNQLEQQQFQNNIAQAPITGQFNNQPTQQAQAQNFNQNLQTNQFNQQAQNQQFNQNQTQQQFAYQQARDSIKDQQYQQQFDQNTQQYGLDYALKQATLANQITNDQAQRAISQQNANTSAYSAQTSASNGANSNANMNQDNLMNIWKATGKAPAGIQGVAEGTPFAGTAKAAATADDFIKSMDNTPLVSNIAGMRRVTDPVAMEKAILDSGMTPEEMTKAYRAYNIPMK